jgi:hypothetical protein
MVNKLTLMMATEEIPEMLAISSTLTQLFTKEKCYTILKTHAVSQNF